MSPTAPRKPCAHPTCPALVNRKDRFCPEHKKQDDRRRWREHDRARGTTAERGYGANHQKLRKVIMAEAPLCPKCEAHGILQAGEEMDHIDGNPWNLERENLQMLCGFHHKQKTAREQGAGFGHAKKEQ